MGKLEEQNKYKAKRLEKVQQCIISQGHNNKAQIGEAY